MAMENYSIKTVNGDFLYGHKWIINNAKANLVIVTGMAEALYRYDEFAKFLNDNYGKDYHIVPMLEIMDEGIEFPDED